MLYSHQLSKLIHSINFPTELDFQCLYRREKQMTSYDIMFNCCLSLLNRNHKSAIMSLSVVRLPITEQFQLQILCVLTEESLRRPFCPAFI